MDKYLVDNAYGIILSILIIIFNFGYVFRNLKAKPSNNDVHKIISDRIKSHRADCNFFDKSDGRVLSQTVTDMKDSVRKIEGKVDKIYDKLLEN